MAFHEDLRNYRLKKGLVLEEISEDTKINVRILQAIEQGDYHILPVPYIRLFMKAYAIAIDFPVEDILRGLENELKLTGEQGITANVSSVNENSVDMSGATVPNTQNMLNTEKGSQNNATRLLLGIAILIIVIVFGKSLLKPNGSEKQFNQRPLLPAIDYSQSLDSLEIAEYFMNAGSDSLTVTSLDYLSLIVENGKGMSDTILYDPGQSYSIVLKDSTGLKLYPSDAALLSIRQDTLPGSPFSNSWLVVTIDSSGSYLRTFPTL